jgi:hypothetical protein
MLKVGATHAIANCFVGIAALTPFPFVVKILDSSPDPIIDCTVELLEKSNQLPPK